MKTLIRHIGEFGLIERIRKSVPVDRSVIKGIGDDCAVLPYSKKSYLLYTCDMLVEGVDFRPQDDPLLVGRKALAVSLSDIASCAGIPRWCLVSIGLPRGTRTGTVDALYRGLSKLARQYSVSVVGGDISAAPKLIIDVSVIGEVEKKKLVLRSGARPGDIIFTTGEFGGSIKSRHLRFEPRLHEAAFLASRFRPSSMIDCSDGLGQDLMHILEASEAGAVLYEELIPISKDAGGLASALGDGEDFELIFTLDRRQASRLLANSSVFRPIGEIVGRKRRCVIIDRHGRSRPLPVLGYRHF
ncbi:MAG TPA: thiamine-phosphate kinase [Candidatus Omnitrophota bacterium]|nr:thiamine-phosphate kinase [Candidatus Omnitrophota bacterium]HQJ15328.1 thiamine-phosphate kinase [Candidatus Omnitrophota bacterium]